MAAKKAFKFDQVVMIAVGCLVLGYLLGIGTSFWIQGQPGPGPRTASAPAPAPAVAPPSSTLGSFSAEIRELQNIVQQDASNYAAWVRLGNLYFDTDQFGASIDAYTKALEIQPGDPNVITDRAIMYRRIGDFNMAAAEFRRAAEIDPTHLNAPLNLGVVLRYDLDDVPGAIRAWQMYLDRNPPPEMAEKIQRELDALGGQAK